MANDGKSAPGGDGKGGLTAGRAPVGNVGAGMPASTAGKAPPFNPVTHGPPPQGSYNASAIAGSTVEGGRFPFSQADAAHASPQRAAQIGAGSLGNSSKPFRVS